MLDWLSELRKGNRKAFAKCLARVVRLRSLGHELRRPEAELLRDGIYELRIGLGTVNYRLLYLFHGRQIAVLAHGLTKEDVVPATEINRARARKRLFEADPEKHSQKGEGLAPGAPGKRSTRPRTRLKSSIT